ncbi:MAG TPA: prolyl oligopeptidase family serine peptidase [Sphingomicrobium sp.]|nr:prolyl oligopeptidase family serine peptidase [Sphingomicrobium sp.]
MAFSMGFWSGLLLATLAIAQPAPALDQSATASKPQNQRRDALADALALPVASVLVGARNAPRFAWVESAAGVRNIWVAGNGSPARPVTAFAQDDGQALYDLALSHDGTNIAFVRGGDPEFADEEIPNADSAASPPTQQIFLSQLGALPKLIGDGHSPIFAPGGDKLAFTRKGEIWLWQSAKNAVRIAKVNGEVRRLSWSPDGRSLLFVDHREDYSFVALLDLTTNRIRYLETGLGFAVEPAFSPDGNQVAFIHYLEPPAGAARSTGRYWSIQLAETASGSTRALWSAPAGPGSRYASTSGRNLMWSAGGEILFPWERSGWLHVHALDPRGKVPRDLTPGAFEVDSFLLNRDRQLLVYSANAGDLDRRHIWRRNLGNGEPVQLTRGEGIESRPTLGGDALAVLASDVARPAFPALVGRRLAPLGRVASARNFVTPTTVRFKAADGVEVRAQLFRAPGPGKRPAIVYVHGGPRRQMYPAFHPSAYYSNAYVLNQFFASQGYDVLAVNYRSGTGFGGDFREAEGIGREGASEYRDILAAGRWLSAQPDVDPARIGIWGGSWGGYLTALALARDSSLFAAGVDFHGVHTLLRPVPDSLSPTAQLATREVQWQASPLAAIDRWTSPVLLIHGDDDKNVKFSQSLLLARELAARQIPFSTLVFPNERHGFLRHAHWLESFRATVNFFDQNLMRKPPTR